MTPIQTPPQAPPPSPTQAPPPATPAEPNPPPRNPAKPILVTAFAVACVTFLFVYRDRLSFDWPTFLAQLRLASPAHILAGIACILATYWLRSLRWAVFLLPEKRIPLFSLLGSQFVGFTAVVLFGRLADLTRPYLVARRVNLSLASQVAVYTIERMFDLAAAAFLFSLALALTPPNAPHHATFVRAGVVSLAGTALLALFALAVRLAGESLARHTRTLLGRVSEPLAEAAALKVLGFRHGLQALASFRDLLIALAISLVLWGLVAESYVQTVHAFTHTPELSNLTFAATMLLMAASMGSSLLQLPIIGWFTQIALTAAAMHTFYGAPLEAATACAAVLLLVINLCIIPIGLVYTRLEGTTLRDAARASKSVSPLIP